MLLKVVNTKNEKNGTYQLSVITDSKDVAILLTPKLASLAKRAANKIAKIASFPEGEIKLPETKLLKKKE